jgi:hypothetical protein
VPNWWNSKVQTSKSRRKPAFLPPDATMQVFVMLFGNAAKPGIDSNGYAKISSCL